MGFFQKIGNALGSAGRAVGNAVKRVTGGSQTASSMSFPVGAGMTPAQTTTANKVLGIAPVSTGINNSQSSNTALVPGQFGGPSTPAQYTAAAQAYTPTYSSGGGSSSYNDSNPNIDPSLSVASAYEPTTQYYAPVLPVSPTTTTAIPSLPSSNVVNAPNVLGNLNTKFDLPEPTATKIPTINPVVETPLDQQIQDSEQKQKVDFQKYLDNIIAPPDSAQSYLRAQEQTGILKKQQAVNTLTGQLNSIVNRGEASRLSLIGQGRGIPDSIIGGQQAQIGRETAIAALPVQAQLSAAQGDLTSAESNLNTLFKIYSDDATNQYLYRKDINEAVYNFASTTEQAKLDGLQKEQDRTYLQEQSDMQAKQQIAFEAIKNGAPSGIITAIIEAPDYNGAIIVGGKYLADPKTKLELQSLRLDIQAKQNEINTFEKYGNLTPAQYNKQIEDQRKSGETAIEDVIMLNQSIDQIDAIMNSSALGSVVGPTVFSRGSTRNKEGQGALGIFGLLSGGGVGGELSGKADDTVALTQQMLDQQFLDKLIAVKSKGATFGALSDNEGNALRNAANAIAGTAIKRGEGDKTRVIGYDMSENEFNHQMTIIQDTMRRARERTTGQIFTNDEEYALDNIFGENAEETVDYSLYFNNQG